MEHLGAHKLRIGKLIHANLTGFGVDALCDFVERVVFGSDVMQISPRKINAFPRKAVQKPLEKVFVCGEKKQGGIIFAGIAALVEAQSGIGLLKPVEVFVVPSEELVVEGKNDIDTLAERGALLKGLVDRFVV